MNRSIRRLGIVLLVMYVALFAQLNNLQLFGAERLNNSPQNSREASRDFERKRGAILTADGLVVAQSVETPDGPVERRREYPEGYKYAHITGYFSRTFGATGIERQYNDELAAKTTEQKYGNLSDLFDPKDRTGNVSLTVDSRVQQAAIDGLGLKRGSVVAIDPRDGAVLAMYSVPSFDPNVLSDPDTKAAGPRSPRSTRTPPTRCSSAASARSSSPDRRSRSSPRRPGSRAAPSRPRSRCTRGRTGTRRR